MLLQNERLLQQHRKFNAFYTDVTRASLRPDVPQGLPSKTGLLFSAQLFSILWMSSLTSVTGEGQGVTWLFISVATRGSCFLGLFLPSSVASLALGCLSSALTLLCNLSLGSCFWFLQLWALDLGSPASASAGSWLWKHQGGVGRQDPHSGPLGRWLSCQ